MALVAVNEVGFNVLIDRFVIVAFVRVAFVPTKLVVLVVVKFPVIAVRVFINAVANARIFPVKLVTVVDARVEEPVASKFPNDPIPETVVEPTTSALRAPFPAVKFVSVVLANVDELVI